MQNNNFIGTGHNPNGPDLPLGFGMQLAQDPEAMDAFGRLTNQQKQSVVNYIQNCTSGEDSKNRIADAVANLSKNDLTFF